MQSGDVFEKKTKTFRKGFANDLEFVYLTAPHTSDTPADTGETVYRWMESVPAFDGSNKFLSSPAYVGLTESFEYIRKFVEEHGPFDGIFGYSQGAVVGSLLLALSLPSAPEEETELKGETFPKFAFRFGILVAGFPARAEPFKHLYRRLHKEEGAQEEAALLHTLHVAGHNDTLVPLENTKKLADLFPGCVWHEHNGGHVIPSNSPMRKAVRALIESLNSSTDSVESW